MEKEIKENIIIKALGSVYPNSLNANQILLNINIGELDRKIKYYKDKNKVKSENEVRTQLKAEISSRIGVNKHNYFNSIIKGCKYDMYSLSKKGYDKFLSLTFNK